MNRRRLYKGKPDTRKFIRYYLDYGSSSRDLHTSLYPHMLIEDLHLGIMPIGGRTKNSNFAVKLVPASERVEKLITAALITYHGEPWDLKEAVCDFVDEAAHILATYGKAYYEIIYVYDDETKTKIKGFMIQGIPNHCIKETLGICWQYVPKKVFERNKRERRFVCSLKRDLLVLAIPKELGRVWKFRRLLKNLKWLSESTVPKFAMEDMDARKQTKGYDFSVYRKNQDTYLAKITRKLGWSARATFDEETLEFYQIFRHLKFEKSKSILRQHIVNRLNATLRLVGNTLGFKARIELEGVPSPQDLDKLLKQLSTGQIHKFSEALNFVYDWRK